MTKKTSTSEEIRAAFRPGEKIHIDHPKIAEIIKRTGARRSSVAATLIWMLGKGEVNPGNYSPRSTVARGGRRIKGYVYIGKQDCAKSPIKERFNADLGDVYLYGQPIHSICSKLSGVTGRIYRQ